MKMLNISDDLAEKESEIEALTERNKKLAHERNVYHNQLQKLKRDSRERICHLEQRLMKLECERISENDMNEMCDSCHFYGAYNYTYCRPVIDAVRGKND